MNIIQVAVATSTALPVFHKYNSVCSVVHDYLFLFPGSITNFGRKLAEEVTKVNMLMVNVVQVFLYGLLGLQH